MDTFLIKIYVNIYKHNPKDIDKGVIDMELLQLQYFQTVARLEHMTKAAEELRIAQPALSKTIARLESDLGVALFDRQNRQIRLNAYGKAFLNKVDEALTAIEEGRKEVTDLAGTSHGIIHLATNSLGRVSKSLGEFRLRYPDIQFRIKQIAPAQMDEMAKLMESGEIDLAFTASPFEQPGIREMPVLDAKVFLAVPPGHRFEGRGGIRLEEAEGEPFVEYKTGHPFAKINRSFCRQAGIRQHIVCEVEEPSALGNLVQAGLGVAFMPACKHDEHSPITLLPILEPECRRVFYLAWHEKRYMSQAARQFQHFLAGYFAQMQQKAAQ